MQADHRAGDRPFDRCENGEPGSERVVRLAPDADLVPHSLLASFHDEARGTLRDLAALLLDRHLRRLARQRNPVEWRLARLLLRLDEASGYLDLGFSRLQDYAAERLGLTARRVQVLLALARRLHALPRIASAYEAGTVSESQVRLLLRVVSPETEAAWLGKAAALNVRLLEREVRTALAADAAAPDATCSTSSEGTEGFADEDDAPADSEMIGVLVPARLRSRWEEALELARRSSGAPDPVWRCAEFIAADYLAGVPDLPGLLSRSLAGGPPESPAGDVQTLAGGGPHSCLGGRGDPAEPRDADLFEEILHQVEEESGARRWGVPVDGLVVILPDSVRDDPADGPRRLDDRLVECVRLRQNLAWHQGRLLRLFADRRLYRELGFLSFSRYCRERAGLGVRRAWHLIALERRLWLLPEIAGAYRCGSLSWVKASAIARVATDRTEKAWLHLARSVTVRRLLDEVAITQAEADRLFVPDCPAPETGRSSPEHASPGHPSLGRSSPEHSSPGPDDSADSPTSAHPAQPGGPPGLDRDGGVQLSAPALRPGAGHPDLRPDSWSHIRFRAPLEVASLWHHAFRVCRALARSSDEVVPAAEVSEAVQPSEAAERSLEDWECLDRLLDSFFATWEVRGGTAWRRRYRIFERDGWRCRVPGCSSRRGLQVHHVVFRSQGGSDEDDNLLVLCATHHLQGIHRGRLRCHPLPGGLMAWELGPDPVRGPVARYVEDVVWDAAVQRREAS
jgi:hypothetical protein